MGIKVKQVGNEYEIYRSSKVSRTTLKKYLDNINKSIVALEKYIKSFEAIDIRKQIEIKRKKLETDFSAVEKERNIFIEKIKSGDNEFIKNLVAQIGKEYEDGLTEMEKELNEFDIDIIFNKEKEKINNKINEYKEELEENEKNAKIYKQAIRESN